MIEITDVGNAKHTYRASSYEVRDSALFVMSDNRIIALFSMHNIIKVEQTRV